LHCVVAVQGIPKRVSTPETAPWLVPSSEGTPLQNEVRHVPQICTMLASALARLRSAAMAARTRPAAASADPGAQGGVRFHETTGDAHAAARSLSSSATPTSSSGDVEASGSGSTPFDFLSRQREKTEDDLDKLTEDGWERKMPKDDAVAEDDEAGQAKEREVGGPKGPEPTRYGDWERAGRCSDF